MNRRVSTGRLMRKAAHYDYLRRIMRGPYATYAIVETRHDTGRESYAIPVPPHFWPDA